MKTVCHAAGRFAPAAFSSVEFLEDRRLFSAAVALTAGTVAAGSITSPTELDSFTFSAAANERVQITTRAGAGTDWSAKFVLKDPTGVVLRTWYNKDQYRSTPSKPLPRTGTYRVEVTDRYSDGTGNYELDLEKLAPVAPAATALVKGAVIAQQTVSHPLDFDNYSFNVASGEIVQIATQGGAGTSFTARYELFNPKGDSVGVWYGSDVKVVNEQALASGAGKYLLQVSDRYNDGTGAYRIGLEGLKPASPGAVAMSNNVTRSRTTTSVLQFDQYAFTTTGTSVKFATTSGAGTSFTAKYEVYDLSGNRLTTFYGSTTKTLTGLSANTKYVLQVSDRYNDGTGTYSVKATGIKAL